MRRVFALLILAGLYLALSRWRSVAHVALRKNAIWDHINSALETSDARLPAHVKPDELTNAQLEMLRRSHRNYLRKISGTTLQHTYESNTAGIVTAFGTDSIRTLLVSLRLLRRTGSKIPVEVVLATDRDYTEHLCEKLLPHLNARCIILSHTLGTRMALKLDESQVRAFAILTSNFEDVLFMEADSLALMQPDALFQGNEYRNTGLIHWSYLNRTVESKLLRVIQGDTQQVQEWSRLSTDAGQTLISKRQHEKTILLSLFYSLYGPSQFFHLLSAGDNTRGESEILHAAADFHKLPSHRVNKSAQEFGFFNSGEMRQIPKDIEHFHTVGLMQFQPDAGIDEGDAKPAFLHWYFPQLDPLNFLAESAAKSGAPNAEHRMWTYIRTSDTRFLPWLQADVATHMPHLGLDPEATIFEQMMHVACADLRSFEGMENACKNLRDHYKTVYLRS